MSDALSQALSLSLFRLAVANAVVPVDVQAGDAESFRGTLGMVSTGDIHLLSLDADAHAAHRTTRLIERGGTDYLKFVLIERGNAVIVQDGREATLSVGDMAVYDTSRPYSLISDSAVRLSLIMFPLALLRIPAAIIQHATAVRLTGEEGVGAVIRPYLASLTSRADEVDARAASRLAHNAIDMVSTLLETNLAVLPTASDPRHRALVQRVVGYIDENLASPELRPSRIAADHFISLRHLHEIFSEYGTSVSTVIRVRRLERCYDDLTDSRLAHRPVSVIGASHGFPDAAHFSRLFRQHFGVSPSGVRPRIDEVTT